jgi:DNA-binding SARP family transcriptional activator/TolB-like protein
MIRLRTLGGLSIERDDSPNAPVLQRRPLALLAVLAAAGDLGISRDKLLAYFWPESDEDRARNVLRQLLHTIRRDLDVPELLVGTTDLRLDSTRLTSDVAEFDRACDAGDHEGAVALYRGPFLDGFYLSSAAGFESWKESERTRLARRFADSAERVARAASNAGDHRRAIGMWHRLAVTEPLNSRVAAELVRALGASGDVGGALAHAKVHEAMLREELDAALPAEFVATVDEVRASADRERSSPDPVRSLPSQTESAAVTPPVDEVRAPSGTPMLGRSRLQRAVVLAIGLGVVTIAALASLRGRIGASSERAQRLNARDIAVLPFDDNTPGGDFGWLANGLAADLIDALSAAPSLSVRSPEAVRPFRHGTVTLDSLAKLLRVGTIVSGSIDSLHDSLRISVRVADASSGSSVSPAVRVMTTRTRIDRARQDIVDSVAMAMRTAVGEYLALKRRIREAGSADAWELLQRAEQARLEVTDNIRRGDTSLATTLLVRADSQLARAEQLAPRWAEPIVLRGWLADVRAGLAAEQPSDRCAEACVAWRRTSLSHASRALALGDAEVPALELRGTVYSELHSAVVAPSEARAALESAERDLLRVLAADTTRARAWLSLGRVYLARGDYLRAAVTSERALKEDPWLADARDALHRQMMDALMRGDQKQASRLCASGQRMLRDHRPFIECRLWILGWLGRTRAAADSAEREFSRIESLPNPPRPDFTWGYRRAMLGAVLARSGARDSARSVIEHTERGIPANDPNWRFQRAFVELSLGDTAGALRSLAQFIRELPQRRESMAASPWFSALHGDVRFQELIRSAR